MSTRYKTVTPGSKPYLPGLHETGSSTTVVYSFVPKPTTWKQTGIRIGRWFIPLSKWTYAPSPSPPT